MGISFYSCANCGRNFPDCSKYFGCFTCGNHFCSDACGGKIKEDRPDDPPDMEEVTTCILCRKESATDHQLLYFLLKRYNLTYDQAMELYRGKQGDLPSSS